MFSRNIASEAMWSRCECDSKTCWMRACCSIGRAKPRLPASMASVSLMTKEVKNWSVLCPGIPNEDGSKLIFKVIGPHRVTTQPINDNWPPVNASGQRLPEKRCAGRKLHPFYSFADYVPEE